MTRYRRELIDLADQVADASRHDRDQHRAAAVHDRRDLTWINGHAYDELDGPETADAYDQ